MKVFFNNTKNAKDKLLTVGGRTCLVLGTTEAVSPDKLIDNVLLLFTYCFYQKSASVKFEIPTYFYYNARTGSMFIDIYLKRLNNLLFEETTTRYYNISPRWNVDKIVEIYMKGEV